MYVSDECFEKGESHLAWLAHLVLVLGIRWILSDCSHKATNLWLILLPLLDLRLIPIDRIRVEVEALTAVERIANQPTCFAMLHAPGRWSLAYCVIIVCWVYLLIDLFKQLKWIILWDRDNWRLTDDVVLGDTSLIVDPILHNLRRRLAGELHLNSLLLRSGGWSQLANMIDRTSW